MNYYNLKMTEIGVLSNGKFAFRLEGLGFRVYGLRWVCNMGVTLGSWKEDGDYYLGFRV